MAAETLTALPVAPTVLVTAPPPPLSLPPGSGPPSIDPIEFLPEPVAEKLRLLRLRSKDSHRLIPEFSDLQEVSTEKIAAANTLRRLTSSAAEGGFNLPPTDRRVLEAQQTLNKLTVEARRISDLRDIRSEQWQATSGAHSNVENWLRQGKPGNTAIEAVEVEEPKLLKNETVLGGIARLRKQGEGVKATLSRIASSPFPSKHARAKIKQEIDAIAKMGAPVVSEVLANNKSVIWPQKRITSQVIADQQMLLANGEVTDTLALLVWLLREPMLAALDKLVDAEKDDAAALDFEAKQIATADAQATLLEIEMQESALIWRGQSEGQPCEHRADCAPQAILACQLVVVPMTAVLPDTDASHAYDIRMGQRR
jgi:hypothetical protein